MADALTWPVRRLRQAAVCLLLVVVTFHQSPGLISNDTKIDLTGDPGRFLERALDLWNPSSAFGGLQNQAYGYLFPMGSFHLLGAWVGMPPWVVQRCWMSLLVVVAFLGVLRLAARLELGTSTTRMLGGLAYALSPRVLTELGGNSSEILPLALLPWVVVPLVGVLAEQRPRRAAMRSGVAVLCMGAVNATAVLSVLVLPGLWLLPGLRYAAGRRLAAWWVLAVTLACTWWVGPLLLQGRYTPNFLDYIETAATTTGTTSLPEVVRGTSNWLGYLAVGGHPFWRAGWDLVTSGGIILNTAVLAALSIAGLLRSRMPAQGRLAAAAAVGLLAMSAAHVGPLDGPFAGDLRHLLDGSLAPFRNVHKFDPVVRLPLAMGLCHLLALATPGRARQALSGLVALALVGAASPALAGQLVPQGGYDRLPAWWEATGAWLDTHAGRQRSLVLPSTGFGEYLWGRPLDNPLQSLTTKPWAVRDAVPLGSPGTTRLLDAINARVDTGLGAPGLAQVLARAGVRYLVVSNDLDPSRTGAPRPVLVHQALESSPGIRLTAAFGPVVTGGAAQRATVVDRGLDLSYQAVEVYEVAGATAPVEVLPQAGAWVISGGPESLFQLADRGLLAGAATVLAGEPFAGPSPRTAMTDALRRREVGFGSVRDNASATLPVTGGLTRRQAAADILPVPGVAHLATARLIGATAVSASSSASDAGAFFDRGPEHQPLSAFDGAAATSWVSGSFTGATGQWVQLDLDHPVDPGGTTLDLFTDDQVRGQVTAVRVTTDAGSIVSPQPGALSLPAGPTTRLRVTIAQVKNDGFGVLAGISEVRIPGVVVQSTIDLPHDQPQRGSVDVLLDRAVGARRGCVTPTDQAVCNPTLIRPGEDAVRLDRTFVLDEAATLPVSGTAQPVAGPALNALLDAGDLVTVTATSQLVPDPAQRPATVVDGDIATGWVAGDVDRSPVLALSWAKARTLEQVTLATSDTLVAARPTRVEVTTPVGSTTVEVARDGVVRFPAVTTARLQVRFVRWEKRGSLQPDGSVLPLPVGVSELALPGVTPVRPAEKVQIPCGMGPPVVVDGVPHPTAALGTRTDLLRLRPLLLSVCDLPGGLPLAAGSHRVVAADQSGLAVQGLTLGSPLPTATNPVRSAQVQRWDTEHRTVDVGPGEASLLVVHENLNPGWRATLGSQELAPQRVDGWQQGFVVPAGSGGTVVLTFTPGRTFHLELLGGAVLVLLLLALALLPARARQVLPATRPVRLPLAVRVVVAALVTVVLGGVVGVVAYGTLLAVLLVVRRVEGEDQAQDGLVLLAGGALVLAGVLTAYSPYNGPRPPAAFGTPAQALALIALGAAAALLSAPRSSSVASAAAPAPPPAAG